ncbi:hypothetical protein ACH40E_38040 [Streptomyces acidicola]|uniref:hypothetical protein n=1 Tax=Streptomyces acidicola TaxID=2596892 RepID=UPI003792CE7E
MNSTTTEQDNHERERQEQAAGLLPALAQLDRTATELERKSAGGDQVTQVEIDVYRHQAAHAQHLIQEAGTEAREVTDAEKDHCGDGDKGFAARALDHATHPRHFEPTPGDEDTARTRDEEEIDL